MRDINEYRTNTGRTYKLTRAEQETQLSFFTDTFPECDIDVSYQPLFNHYMDYAQKYPEVLQLVRDVQNYAPRFHLSDMRYLCGNLRLRAPLSEDQRKARGERFKKNDSEAKNTPTEAEFED